jgi:hypothetical protein
VGIKGTSSLKKPERRKLAVFLGRALALAVGGKLYLFGKGNGDGACLYWAVANAPARPSTQTPVLFPID